MKKYLCILLAAVTLLSLLSGCAGEKETAPVTTAAPAAAEAPETVPAPVTTAAPETAAHETTEPAPLPDPIVCDDGRARPSCCGQLQVVNGKLCDDRGEPVMLRGFSSKELIAGDSFVSDKLFRELAEEDGVNLFRLAMYTYGVGIVGYCTKGDRERYKKIIANGVEYARMHDMYVLIDWHILNDGDPNTYVEESKEFFAEMSAKYAGYNNVLYEICNEPNGIDWATVKRYAEQVIPVIRGNDPDSVIIVGNPDWSKDLYNVAADPLDFENVMYTFHFYAANHGQNFRDMVQTVSENGLPVFVTEFGVTSANGRDPIDLESGDLWIELLEKENISYCNWCMSNASEACSAIRSAVKKYHGYEPDDYSESGKWMMETLAKHNSR